MAVYWRGVRLDERTRDMLVEAEKLAKVKIRPTQGSYSTSVGASAGTHSTRRAFDTTESCSCSTRMRTGFIVER